MVLTVLIALCHVGLATGQAKLAWMAGYIAKGWLPVEDSQPSYY